ncbi:Arc family DNA-binding protein [Cronobacter sakazakii]|nr:Arc family DNA-binding protein [Cronobacter sakazakii]ELY4737452.1 Arc family DNA-binding protein [Cronobacter sakazakii]MDI7599188.1 Arc family DNA-binding protein [Cronobacter sakazakii]MDK1033494.1 Arc family DNA-binding protein [Cronobacter sakazakii]MDK1123725.1 Arc family DNA-binding protein [Cronobacter sakazakii]
MSERRYRHPQVNLRLPEDLKEKISALAERNKRSANAEMVAAIEDWIRRDEVHNFRSETSLVSMRNEDINDDEDYEVSLTQSSLNKIINQTAEEAAQLALHIITNKYEILPKPEPVDSDGRPLPKPYRKKPS